MNTLKEVERLWIVTRKPSFELHKQGDILIKFEMPEKLVYKHNFLNNTPEDALIFYNNYLDSILSIIPEQLQHAQHMYPIDIMNAIYFGKYLRQVKWEECTIENYKKNHVYGY